MLKKNEGEWEVISQGPCIHICVAHGHRHFKKHSKNNIIYHHGNEEGEFL